ncbi:MAG: hypothetical protein BMS9Abin36_1303 [Gammaproteobacteria bacterium]|nr:MAG: hypothetical protein BMS9Abin36_1303 [Gammaproteobacteria bacterium]
MYWDDDKQEKHIVSDDVMDMVYGIRCRSLPVDHAHALYQALSTKLTWLKDEPTAGVHPIHVLEFGNGWMRPEAPNELLQLSRRIKLELRLPKHRIQEAEALVGQTLDVAGNELQIIKARTRPLTTITTIFSRYIVADSDDEGRFMDNIIAELKVLGIRPEKMLPGRVHTIHTPDGQVAARSLMVAGLRLEDSITLQQRGLGSHRHLGCGLFIPHKGISEVSPAQVMR